VINFADTLNFVHDHNDKYENGSVTFKCGINSRAILSLEERKKYMNGLMLEITPKIVPEVQPSFPPAPLSLDYRIRGYVGEVVDQGDEDAYETGTT
jgi:hypothetical protein